MIDITLKLQCKHNAHCRTCRDQQGGQAWREAVGAPEQCPQNHSWGYVPPAGVQPLPPIIDERQQQLNELADDRRAACKRGCTNFAQQPGLGRCTLQHPDETTSCPCAAWFRDPASKCPAGKWAEAKLED